VTARDCCECGQVRLDYRNRTGYCQGCWHRRRAKLARVRQAQRPICIDCGVVRLDPRKNEGGRCKPCLDAKSRADGKARAARLPRCTDCLEVAIDPKRNQGGRCHDCYQAERRRSRLERLAALGKLECKNCGKGVSPGSRTGLCIQCARQAHCPPGTSEAYLRNYWRHRELLRHHRPGPSNGARKESAGEKREGRPGKTEGRTERGDLGRTAKVQDMHRGTG